MIRKQLIRSSALAAVCLAALASVQAQAASCETAQFGPKVLEKFPNVRAVCLDVITRDGQDYAVFKAELVRTSGKGLYVRAKRADGTKGKTTFVALSKERRILVDGKPVRAQELALGQELTAYAKVSEPMLAFVPVENDPIELSPIEDVPEPVATAPDMPKTASLLPLAGALGAGLMFAGLAFGRMRKRLAI